jgi:hypothetical protein
MWLSLSKASMTSTVEVSTSSYQRKYATSTFHPGNTSGETVIVVNGTRPLTRREFVVGYLRKKGKNGAFVNEMYKAWNQMRVAIQKPRSPYPSFRKLIWSMKKEKIIVPIPKDEIRAKNLLGDAPISRSYYRLPGFSKSG